MKFKYYTLLVILLIYLPVHSETIDCIGLLSDSLLATRLQDRVNSEGGEDEMGQIITVQDGPYYTCQVQGTNNGTYQQLSVIATYTIPTDPNTVRVRQFELDCIEANGNFVWQGRVGSFDMVSGSVDYMNIETMINCSACTIDAGNDHHCEACDPNCNMGLMRCTGSSSSDCCVAFNDGVCSPNFNFYCEDSPCANGGTCMSDSNGYTCMCSEGFTGENCNSMIDYCMDDPCLNGGSCTSDIDGYMCLCDEGFTGKNCSSMINYCMDDPCLNGGSCTSDIDGYMCLCDEGFTGENCSSMIDYCMNNPCLNGGSCTSDIDGYMCLCDEGFTGENCSSMIDYCMNDPCLNGGTCNEDNNNYTCVCPIGYTGNDCEIDIDGCAGMPCQNGGSCIDQIPGYACMCAQGYTGSNCEAEVDNCANNPCLNGSTCVNTIDGYICICSEGFTGDLCDVNIDDCATDPCLNGGICIDGIDQYMCMCPEGYTDENCSLALVDECASNPCQFGGVCVDEVLGYYCICGDDFTGDNCETILDTYDECRQTCRQSVVFDRDLCLFYCQLEEWRETMNMLGLVVPAVEELKNENATSESRWRTAAEHHQLYFDIWVEFAEDQELFFEQEATDNRDSLISEWQMGINSEQGAIEAWREYSLERNPDVNFVDFPNDDITEDLTGEQLSAIYANISREWSSDLNIYKTELTDLR